MLALNLLPRREKLDTPDTTPPNQGLLDKKSKCEEMMRMAQGTLRDAKNAISSHLPSVIRGFSGKTVTDGNLDQSALSQSLPNDKCSQCAMMWSTMENQNHQFTVHKCSHNVFQPFFLQLHAKSNLPPMNVSFAITCKVQFAPHECVIRVRVTELVEPVLVL